MRILIAADIFPPVGGGPAIYAAGLANALTGAGDAVTVVSLTPGSDKTAANGSVFSVTKKNKVFRYLEYFGLLIRNARQVDIIYAMGPVNAGLPALLAARLFGKKFAVKVVGDYAWEQGVQRFGIREMIDEFQTKKYSSSVSGLQKIQRLVARSADVVIVPCEYLTNIVIGWGVLSDKIKVIYNAVEFNKNPTAEVLTKEQNEQWVLTVTRLVPWKGIKVLMSAFRKVSADWPNAKLKIIGDGPERTDLVKFAQLGGVENKIEFLGNVPNETVHAYMKNSEIFVLNSGYEGLSHVLVEAVQADCRVLASSAGGNPEVVIPGETGELFPYNDEVGLEKLLRAALAGSGGQSKPFSTSIKREDFFHKFGWETMISTTRELLKNICAR